jgi:hypothetical protein
MVGHGMRGKKIEVAADLAVGGEADDLLEKILHQVDIRDPQHDVTGPPNPECHMPSAALCSTRQRAQAAMSAACSGRILHRFDRVNKPATRAAKHDILASGLVTRLHENVRRKHARARGN